MAFADFDISGSLKCAGFNFLQIKRGLFGIKHFWQDKNDFYGPGFARHLVCVATQATGIFYMGLMDYSSLIFLEYGYEIF